MSTTHAVFHFFKSVIGVIISFVLLFSHTALAEEEVVIPPGPSIPTIDNIDAPGVVNCFDYYSFGSVGVDVAPLNPSVYTTDTLLFAGNVTNENPYPVVDGQIWMKVFKMDQVSPEKLKENGYPLVDFVLVQDEVLLPSQGSIPVEFDWMVPKYAAEGEYMAAFFFTTAHRYNLLGLSFTDDVTGNTTNFEVSRATPFTPVTFDKNSVRLNDTPTSFALPPRQFDGTQQVMAYATLVNNAPEDRRVELTWTAYKWDGIREAFKQDTKTEMVQIPGNSKLEVAYETPVRNTAVTFVEAQMKEGDAKSMLHIRYVRDEVEETRINFPSTFTYPLVAGEPAEIFSCVHTTNLPVVSDNNLTLTLQDVNGNTLHSYTYEGDISGAMMGLADTFTPKKDYASFVLTASLMRNGNLVESVTTTYDCNQIDSSLCTADDVKKEGAAIGDETDRDQSGSKSLQALLLVIVLGLVVYLIVSRRKHGNQDGGEETDEFVIDNKMHLPENDTNK